MKHRDFVFVGETIPKIDMTEHADFVFHLQKAMLLSLVKRELLSVSQMEQVIERIGKRESSAHIKL